MDHPKNQTSRQGRIPDFQPNSAAPSAELGPDRVRTVYSLIERNGGNPAATNTPRNLRQGSGPAPGDIPSPGELMHGNIPPPTREG